MATEESVLETCRRRGVSRRRFMEFCGTMAATLALPKGYTQTIATALGQKRKPVMVWLEFQDCAGNTESHAALDAPDHRRHRPRDAFARIPRDHHGGLRQAC